MSPPSPPLPVSSSLGPERRVATAGWTIPRALARQFPAQGSGLERYCARFNAVEINSTFYGSHRASTYLRWVQATPPDFRFAVKLPRTITHKARLVDTTPLLRAFRGEIVQLREKLGPLLVQLPPSLAFHHALAERFLADLRDLWPETIVCEPRHPSWFDKEVDALMSTYRVGRVAADPPPHPAAGAPGGWRGVCYWRLHGSPRMYVSSYGEAALAALAAEVRAASGETWCVFDNTTAGAAADNALKLQALVAS